MNQQSMIDAMSDGVIILDSELRITHINQTAQRIMGHSESGVLGNTPHTLFPGHPDIDTLLANRDSLSQEIILRREGEKRHFDLRASLVRDPENQVMGYLVVLRDITERVQAEAEAERQRIRAQNYLTAANVIIVAIDVKGEVTLINQRGYEVLGYAEEDIVGKNWFQHFLPERIRDELEEVSGQAFAGDIEAVKYVENPILTKNGEERIIAWRNTVISDETGRIQGLLSSGEDVTEWNAAKRELEESEQRYRTLVESIGEGFGIADEDERFVFANPALEDIFGVPVGALIGQDLKDFLGEEQYALIRRQTELRRSGERSHYEVEITRPDGERVSILISASPQYDENGRYTGSLGIFRDITEWHQAQEALRAAHLQQLAILESIDADIYVADMQTHEILFMNQAMQKSFGENLVGKVCFEEFRGASTPCPHCTNGNLLDSDGNPVGVVVWEGQNPITGKWYMNYDRAIDWVDGRIVRLQIATDITERKQSEEDLRQAKEEAERLYRIVPSGIFTVDTNGIVTSINDKALEITGYSADELLGQSCTTFAAPPCHGQCGLYEERTTKPITASECIIRTKDGRNLTVSKNADLIRDAQGRIVGGVESFEDITERKRTEDALIAANKELEQAVKRAQQLAVAAEQASLAKSEFLANMSHEIRTPMNGIIGMTELALTTELTQEQYDYLTAVQVSANSLLGLLNDILDLSKIEAGRLSIDTVSFNLREMIENVTDIMAQRTVDKNLELIFHIATEVPTWLRGDPLRLRQILVNLIGNAIKFTERGEVIVRIGAGRPANGQVELHCSVSDTGIGISQDKLDMIFDSFSQADGSITRQYGGSGLGLAISKQLVNMMGGRIWVESKEGVGSTFSFTAFFERSEQPEAETPLDFEYPLSLRTLIVDDNPTNLQVVRECLRSLGTTAEEVTSGIDALRVLTRSITDGHLFELILLDVQMPGLSGLDVLAAIRQMPALNTVGVIMLTSVDDLPNVTKLRSLGWSAYLTKPIKQSQLRRTILQVAGRLSLSRPGKAAREESKPPISLRILLVEDNEINRRVAKTLLERAGHSVAVAENGKVALAALEEANTDLIFMDVQMPEMDGLEATASIRSNQKWAHLPIIAMTAHAMEGDRERFLAAGMDDYVTKPIRPERMLAAIERQLDRHNLPSHPDAEADDALPVLDRKGVLDRLAGDQRMYDDLLSFMLENLTATVSEIRRAVDTQNLPQASILAHSLKGEAATLGAERVRHTAARLEDACQQDIADEARAAMAELEQEVDVLQKHAASA